MNKSVGSVHFRDDEAVHGAGSKEILVRGDVPAIARREHQHIVTMVVRCVNKRRPKKELRIVDHMWSV
jgi:hypothetical protein